VTPVDLVVRLRGPVGGLPAIRRSATSGAGTLEPLSFVNCSPSGRTCVPAVGADAGTVTVTVIAGTATAGTSGTATGTVATYDTINTQIAGDRDATQAGAVTIDAPAIDLTLTSGFTCTVTPASTLPLAVNESGRELAVTNSHWRRQHTFAATWSTAYGVGSPAGGLTLDA
jgi:hypothetical protein